MHLAFSKNVILTIVNIHPSELYNYCILIQQIRRKIVSCVTRRNRVS